MTQITNNQIHRQQEYHINRQNKQGRTTLDGLLINNYKEDQNVMNKTCETLIIPQIPTNNFSNKKKKEPSFDFKKALMPLFLGTIATFGGIAGLSMLAKSSAKRTLGAAGFERLPDLALNMNIRQEPQFAIYRMIRDPNMKNIHGAAAIIIFSAIGLVGKSFVDGVKQVWIKKREADINYDLQQNLIAVETKSFAGKLEHLRNMLSEKANYFKKIFEENKTSQTSFKGERGSEQKNEKRSTSKQNLLYGVAAIATLALGVFSGRIAMKNVRKTFELANDFANNYTTKTMERIDELVSSKDLGKKEELKILLQSIYARQNYIEKTFNGLGLKKPEIDALTQEISEKAKTLFADAPTALGGIPQKIQYYCYMDEDRGHLYNYIINPENKFTKYIFFAFTIFSAMAYTGKQAVEAVQKVAIAKENAKTELNLADRLVSVEIDNFKAKKASAVEPLIDSFNSSLKDGKNPDGLKTMAESILQEIKSGPPFVYS